MNVKGVWHYERRLYGAPWSRGVEKLVLRLAQGEGGARCSVAVARTTVRAAQTSLEYVTDLQVSGLREHPSGGWKWGLTSVIAYIYEYYAEYT